MVMIALITSVVVGVVALGDLAALGYFYAWHPTDRK